LGTAGALASPAGSTAASMVGSIVPTSEVSLLLLVPTSIKLESNVRKIAYVIGILVKN
jgi:hypothetical protein